MSYDAAASPAVTYLCGSSPAWVDEWDVVARQAAWTSIAAAD